VKSFLRAFCYCILALIGFAAASQSRAQTGVSEIYATADDGTPLTWTVYTPTGAGPWPAVLVIHGGFFFAGSEADNGPVECAQDLASAGYLAFSISYRLAPPGSIPGQKSLGRFPDQPNDVRLAVEAARNDPRANGQVGAVGGSSGATHAAWVANTGTVGADRLDVAVCFSGAYDFSDFRADTNIQFFIDTVTNYVGVPASDITSLRAASPAWQVGNTVAPLYLINSVGDSMPPEQQGDMVTYLTSAGATNFQAKTLPGSGHSFENWDAVKGDAIAFLANAFSAPPPTPTPTPSPSPTPPPGNTLLNISTRARAGTGNHVLIGGFIVANGGGTKKVIVRAIGPSLVGAGLTNVLADPSLALFDSGGKLLASNDDWINGGQSQEIVATGLAPSDNKESALIADLAPSAYTAVVSGVDSGQNIALVEIYDLESGNAEQLLNLSTRGVVGDGDGVMIAGSIIGGTLPETLVMRGIGPSLGRGPAPIPNVLPDPTLRLVDGQGTTIFSNDNWQDSQAAEITALGLAPGDALESALVVTLPPGSYTAILSDTHGASGVGLLETYNVTGSSGTAGK
jgi:acetyl esterase/lipase